MPIGPLQSFTHAISTTISTSVNAVKHETSAVAQTAQVRMRQFQDTFETGISHVMTSADAIHQKIDRTHVLLHEVNEPAKVNATKADHDTAIAFTDKYFSLWSTKPGQKLDGAAVRSLYDDRATVSDIPPELAKLSKGSVDFTYHDINHYLHGMEKDLYPKMHSVEMGFDRSKAKVEPMGPHLLKVTVPFHNKMTMSAHGPAMNMSGVAQLIVDKSRGKIMSEELVLGGVSLGH